MSVPAADRVPRLPVALFTVLALALGLGSQALMERGAEPLVFVAVHSPALAGLVLRKLVAREGFGDAGFALLGVAPLHWLLAALLPLAWHATGVLLEAASGACAFQLDVVAKALPRWPLAATGAAICLAGEELGWRSYLVAKLRPAAAYAPPRLGLVRLASGRLVRTACHAAGDARPSPPRRRPELRLRLALHRLGQRLALPVMHVFHDRRESAPAIAVTPLVGPWNAGRTASPPRSRPALGRSPGVRPAPRPTSPAPRRSSPPAIPA